VTGLEGPPQGGPDDEEATIRRDPRSVYVLDTFELGRRPGTMRKVHQRIEAAADLGTEVIGIPKGSDLELDLRLEAVMEGVLVSGEIRGHATGECIRCLESVELDVSVTLQELYAYPERVVDEDDDVRELLKDDLIDLEPAVRDAVVLALPFQPVCDDDCPGLCSECGIRLVEQPDHHHDIVDPRWAALQELQDDEKES
jgi:uncharacterized protein